MNIVALAHSHMQLKVTLKEGEILPNVAPPRSGDRLERMLSRALETHVRRPYHIDAVSYPRSVEINLQLREGVLTVIASRKRLFSSTTYVFVMWMVGSSLILFAVATMFMRNQVRPIRRLAAAADSFGKGRDVPDFKPSGAIEVRQAACARRKTVSSPYGAAGAGAGLRHADPLRQRSVARAAPAAQAGRPPGPKQADFLVHDPATGAPPYKGRRRQVLRPPPGDWSSVMLPP